MQSVVTGQAPINLEWKITTGRKQIKQYIIHNTETNRIPQTIFMGDSYEHLYIRRLDETCHPQISLSINSPTK